MGKVRKTEAADFAAEEKELSEIIDTLERAHGILEKQLKGGAASMLQMQNINSVTQALSAMVDASVFSSADASRLTALVQSSQKADDESLGAPAAAVYESHTGGILDTLDDLSEKAEAQLADARQAETTALHNFEMLKQSLQDQIKFATKDFDEAKKNLAASAQKKAANEGDLEVTSKELGEDKVALEDLKQDCMAKAQDYEAETKSRDEELKALAEAKKVISDSTGGADSLSYGDGAGAASFVQLKSESASAEFKAVRFVRDLAQKHGSAALVELASRMASAFRLTEGGTNGQDPFGKVRDLISGMIEQLEADQSAEATEKAWCDKETAESTAKKEDSTEAVEKLTTKIDQAKAKSAQLKEQVSDLQKSLLALTSSQAEMDKMRNEEKATYTKNKAEMEQGIEGVKLALKVLREYYAKDDTAHDAGTGAGSSIVGLLEVVESDFTKGLAEMTAVEEGAQASYEKETNENAVTKATKEKDVEYKTKESVELDKSSTELTSDRANEQEELDAVTEYLKKVEERCVAKPETYEDRVKNRAAEIEGLKEALTILESEESSDGAALVQTKRTKRTLRGYRHRQMSLKHA